MQELAVDVAIIGAGTAGLSAFKEASKVTDKIVLIDHGPLGTTCARVGCMPSKTLIQTANYFHNKVYLSELGIDGADGLKVDPERVMKHVRTLRDYFTSSTIQYIKSLGNKFIQGGATFIEKNKLSITHPAA